MKKVLITEDCRYAQDKPSKPQLEFKEGQEITLDDYLADSLINNEQATEDLESKEKKPKHSIEPEIKEKPKKSARGKKGK